MEVFSKVLWLFASIILLVLLSLFMVAFLWPRTFEKDHYVPDQTQSIEIRRCIGRSVRYVDAKERERVLSKCTDEIPDRLRKQKGGGG